MNRSGLRALVATAVMLVAAAGLYFAFARPHAAATVSHETPMVGVGSEAAPTVRSIATKPGHPPPTVGARTARVSTTSDGASTNSDTALFRASWMCHEAAQTIEETEPPLKSCAAHASDPQQQEFYRRCQENLKGYEERLAAARAQLARCAGRPADQARKYYETVVNAARAGDADAQVCYVEGRFGEVAKIIERTEFTALSKAYSQRALERGDWRIVQLLGRSSTELAHSDGLGTTLPLGQVVQVYRMNRLKRLGATPEYGALLDSQAIDLVARLRPAQIDAADAWAKREFAAHFAASPPLSGPAKPCSIR